MTAFSPRWGKSIPDFPRSANCFASTRAPPRRGRRQHRNPRYRIDERKYPKKNAKADLNPAAVLVLLLIAAVILWPAARLGRVRRVRRSDHAVSPIPRTVTLLWIISSIADGCIGNCVGIGGTNVGIHARWWRASGKAVSETMDGKE